MVPVELTMCTMSFYTEVGNWLFISFGSELTVMCLRKTLKKNTTAPEHLYQNAHRRIAHNSPKCGKLKYSSTKMTIKMVLCS